MRVPVDSPRRQQSAAQAADGQDNDRDLVDRLAVRLHELRNERQLTLDQLARSSGVSRAMLWQVEQGRSAPTIKVLARVAEALSVPINAFLEHSTRPAVTVLRRDESRQLRSADGRSASRALFPYSGVHDVEFYELKLEPGGVESAEPHPPGTHENLVVTQGRVEIEVGEQRHELACGDALYFAADTQHVYRNVGSSPALIYLVVSHPNRLNYG
jgi:transcriptional regulator with XRE-family HTH domain